MSGFARARIVVGLIRPRHTDFCTLGLRTIGVTTGRLFPRRNFSLWSICYDRHNDFYKERATVYSHQGTSAGTVHTNILLRHAPRRALKTSRRATSSEGKDDLNKQSADRPLAGNDIPGSGAPAIVDLKSKREETGVKLTSPELDWEYILNPDNTERIQKNIDQRKGVGDIFKVKRLWSKVKFPDEIEEADQEVGSPLKQQLLNEAMSLPNHTQPDVPIGDESQNRLVRHVGVKREFSFEPKSVTTLGADLGMLRTENLGHSTGPRTYYLLGGLAQLEQALIRYSMDMLKQHGFLPISVPDLINPGILERHGFKINGDRTQVYTLDPQRHGQVALAGTGEMSLVGMLMGQTFNADELPKKLMTVSRCYRAETSDAEYEKGIYRVHHFTKVEMFGVTSQDGQTEQLMEQFLDHQVELFSALGLHFRVLDMASQELGAAAARKYDMEAWMPAKAFWGEVSSTSNCLDYQSRRFNIKYTSGNAVKHAHTINGTACAIPRIIMAILENNQREDGSILLPEVLHKYMDGVTELHPPKHPIKTKAIKLTKLYKSKVRSQ